VNVRARRRVVQHIGSKRRTMKTFLAHTVDEWRDWLAEHHDSVPEVWLIFYKRHAAVSSINHKDALDEALCFGWIDSLVKRLDDRRYAIKFTPRRADSRWSDVNRKRYKELKASGRIQPPGLERPPTSRTYAPRPTRFELPATLPINLSRSRLRIGAPCWFMVCGSPVRALREIRGRHRLDWYCCPWQATCHRPVTTPGKSGGNLKESTRGLFQERTIVSVQRCGGDILVGEAAASA